MYRQHYAHQTGLAWKKHKTWQSTYRVSFREGKGKGKKHNKNIINSFLRLVRYGRCRGNSIIHVKLIWTSPLDWNGKPRQSNSYQDDAIQLICYWQEDDHTQNFPATQDPEYLVITWALLMLLKWDGLCFHLEHFINKIPWYSLLAQDALSKSKSSISVM